MHFVRPFRAALPSLVLVVVFAGGFSLARVAWTGPRLGLWLRQGTCGFLRLCQSSEALTRPERRSSVPRAAEVTKSKDFAIVCPQHTTPDDGQVLTTAVCQELASGPANRRSLSGQEAFICRRNRSVLGSVIETEAVMPRDPTGGSDIDVCCLLMRWVM